MKSAFATALLVFVLVSCSVTTYVPARTAAKFYDQGDYVNAIQYYMKAVADRDQRAETFYGLGMSFYRHGDLEEAMLALERSFEKDSSDVVVIERLALVNLDLGNIQKAGTYSHKAVHLDNEFAEAYNTLGHVFFEGGELDSAEDYFESALTLSQSLRWRTTTNAAFTSFEEVQAEANNGLGEICIERGLFYSSLGYFNAANSLVNYWETPWFNKGRAYEALGNTRAAEVAYQRTIDLAPRNAEAYKNLARIYRRNGRDYEAMNLYRQAIRIDSTDVECYYSLAELYKKEGDNWNAADTYNSAVDKAPDDPTWSSRAASANMVIGNYELAIEFLNSVLELQPQNAGAQNSLGEAYQADGDTVQAQKAFESAVALDSLFTPPLRNLGTILLAQGKEDQALGCFIRAARLGDARAAEFLRSRGIRWE